MMIASLSLLDPMDLYTTAISSWTVPLYIMVFSSATKNSLSVTLSDPTVHILSVTTTIHPPVESLFGSIPYVLGVLQIIFLRPSINFSVVPLSVSGAISLQLKANMHLRSTMIVRLLSTLPVQVMKKNNQTCLLPYDSSPLQHWYHSLPTIPDYHWCIILSCRLFPALTPSSSLCAEIETLPFQYSTWGPISCR